MAVGVAILAILPAHGERSYLGTLDWEKGFSGGAFWIDGPPSASGRYDSIADISCPTTTTCVVTATTAPLALHGTARIRWAWGTLTGARLAVTGSGNAVGNLRTTFPIAPVRVSCSSVSRCVVPGAGQPSIVDASDDGGSTLTPATVPADPPVDGHDAPYRFHCDPGSWCYGADGSRLIRSTDGGLTWTTLVDIPPAPKPAPHHPAPLVERIGGGTCSTVDDCVAVGSDGDQAALTTVTTDGGATWSTGSVPPAATSLDEVSCSGPLQCTALATLVGSGYFGTKLSLASTNDGGRSWTLAETVPWVGEVNGLSCPSADVCLLTGTITGTDDIFGGGSTGGPYQRPYDQGVVLGTSDGGTSWQMQLQLGGNSAVSSVSCSTDNDCAAGVGGNLVSGNPPAGAGVEITTDGGRNWQLVAFPTFPVKG